ncbi:MAG: transposase [Solirubrobacteraceae bacterium]
MVSHASSYSPEFRREAVALLKSSGKTVPQLAAELGVSPQSLRNWARQIDVDGQAPREAAARRVRRYRRPRRISRGPMDAAAERAVLHPLQQGRLERRRERRHSDGVRRSAARALGEARQTPARHRARRRRHHSSR